MQTIQRSRIPHSGRLAIDLIAVAIMFQDELGRVEPIYTEAGQPSITLPLRRGSPGQTVYPKQGMAGKTYQ